MGNGGTEEIMNNNVEEKGKGVVDGCGKRNEYPSEENTIYFSHLSLFVQC